MKKTRCKFVCTSVENFGTQRKVHLDARYDDDKPEDLSFSLYTPCGSMTFNVTNPECFDSYVPGQAYYIDIIPIEALAS